VEDDQRRQVETLSFRIDPALKSALAEIAGKESKPVGALLREWVRERIKQERRREFELEARRQSLAIAELARDPSSDEAAVLRELEAYFDDFADDW